MQGADHGKFREADALVLSVTQCSAPVFRLVLHHIYTGHAAPDPADVWELIAAAEFYLLEGLQVLFHNNARRLIHPPVCAARVC